MGFMTWEKQYEIGIPEMDRQHKKWLEMLNRFYDNLADGDVTEKMKTLVQEVLDYTEYHFSEEEKLMNGMGYPAIGEQKEMHDAIKQKIIDFKKKLDDGRTIVSLSITAELKTWFREHIMIEDKKYAETFLSGHAPR